MENWQQILFVLMRADVNNFMVSLYLLSWIFLGNYVLLNLFLAILLDGFQDVSSIQKDLGFENEFEEEDAQEEEEKQKKANLKDLKNWASKEVKELTNTEMEQLHDDDMDPEEEMKATKNKGHKKKKKLFDGIECETSLFYFTKKSKLRQFCYQVVQHKYFDSFVLVVIITSSMKLVMDTYLDKTVSTGTMGQLVGLSGVLDIIFNVIFLLECAMKIISYGLAFEEKSYLQENWNQLDFFIVCSSLIDIAFENVDIPIIKVSQQMPDI